MPPKIDFLGKNLLFLIAHPDDEAVLAAGTIHANAFKGGKNYIVCATAGERGKGHLSGEVDGRTLKRIRKRELKKLCTFLSVNKLHVLNLPDAEVSQNKKALNSKFLILAEKYRPDYIIGFGPDGVTGHLDHVACGAVAANVAKKLSINFLTFCAAPHLAKKGKSWLLNRRKHGNYLEPLNHSEPDIKIKVSSKIKLKCLGFHKSQKLLQYLPKRTLQQILNYEYFCETAV